MGLSAQQVQEFRKQAQSLPLEAKIVRTQQRIREWYDHWKGNVYVSFSGGKDSTVLLHLVRDLYPGVPAVFCDTGLEYPQTREFVKSWDNVEWIKPRLNFKTVLEKYGYPVVNKEQADFIRYVRSAKTKSKTYYNRLHGNDKWAGGKISKKWLYLLDAPFKISAHCCKVMKKQPFAKYERRTGRWPYLGTVSSESPMRNVRYIKHGCNIFHETRPKSNPLSFWTEQDILQFIRDSGLSYSPTYGRIVEVGTGNTRLRTVLEERTGCMFCVFGIHLERPPNKFQRMKDMYPKQYKFCMDVLGLREVLEFMNIPYN